MASVGSLLGAQRAPGWPWDRDRCAVGWMVSCPECVLAPECTERLLLVSLVLSQHTCVLIQPQPSFQVELSQRLHVLFHADHLSVPTLLVSQAFILQVWGLFCCLRHRSSALFLGWRGQSPWVLLCVWVCWECGLGLFGMRAPSVLWTGS